MKQPPAVSPAQRTAAASRIAAATEQATGMPYRPGNTLQILHNGDEIFPAMLQAIREAKHTIEFVTYVYWRSDIAEDFAAALCERARAGVQVRILLDAVGAALIGSRTIWRLERAGARVAWFRPGRWAHLHKLNNRTHRKILLIDGHTGFTGGVGIAAEWTGHAQDRRHWREIHCRLTGPACADLLTGFTENWAEATGERLSRVEPITASGEVAIQAISSTTGPRPTQMERLFTAAIAAAEDRLWITTAYFVPSPAYVTALIAAARRGVDVRILTNGTYSNHPVARRAGHASYDPLLRGGVKLYEYRPTVLHSKLITVDAAWATLGSTNLDDRSLVLNDELNIAFTDPTTIAALDQRFLKDLAQSDHIRTTHWYQRGWIDRAAEAASSVFRRQL